jgi:hypothetical protein
MLTEYTACFSTAYILDLMLPGAVETESVLGFAEGLTDVTHMARTVRDMLGLYVIPHTLPKIYFRTRQNYLNN